MLPLSQSSSSKYDGTESLLLLGLHPDECTEDIVDAAIEHDLSFAIVPCCVFPDLFPTRRMLSRKEVFSKSDTKDTVVRHDESYYQNNKHTYPHHPKSEQNKNGTANYVPVRSYNDFLQYLMDKDDGIRMVSLPFEGKNTVLYKVVPH
mmetsp:Transcript_15359/g.36822  ORF Transcript_15359/g.36822 Transcript_15359/m.36822 type:complete len:148 (+) Transcript_15359:40-483(+)